MNRIAPALFFAFLASLSNAQSVATLKPVASALENYGQALSASTPGRAIVFKKVEKTGSSFYKVSFQTSAPGLLSAADAKKNPTSKLANLGRTKIWEMKFCTDQLKSILIKHDVSIAAGILENTNGEIQSAAICAKEAPNTQTTAPGKLIGSWYDDMGSPTFLDATYTIASQDGKTYLTRINGDGSKGSYELGVAGNTYVKIGDKFGAYYIVMPEGLRIYDKRGFIRLLKAK